MAPDRHRFRRPDSRRSERTRALEARTQWPTGVIAEGVGFEPTEPRKRFSSFQDCRLRPLGHPSE